VVREDAHILFGFGSDRDAACFASCSISGIGPKLALSILSGINVDEH
jgi:Holliday junction resolvasome RuvABC DNA-binding subunit